MRHRVKDFSSYATGNTVENSAVSSSFATDGAVAEAASLPGAGMSGGMGAGGMAGGMAGINGSGGFFWDSHGNPLPLYKAAYLHEDAASGLHIVYAVLDPRTGKYKRFRVKLNRFRASYPSKRQFRRFAERLCQQLNMRLSCGWTPQDELQNARFYTPLEAVVDAFLKDKEGEVRHATLNSYSSTCSILTDWAGRRLPGCQIIDFGRLQALEFMLYLRDERQVSNRTYNNYLKQLRVLFEWAIQHLYCKENPFRSIKARRREPKRREVIDAAARARIRLYLEEHNRPLLLFAELVYFALMRPAEIRRCTIGQVNLKEHYILIPADQAKCGRERCAPLSDELCGLIAEHLQPASHGMKGKAFPRSYHLFGTGMHPGPTATCSKKAGLDWDKMRKALGLKETMTLYSLRDSGIVEMLHQGVDDLTVMHAAGHHDLSITSVYADHADKGMIERVRQMQRAF